MKISLYNIKLEFIQILWIFSSSQPENILLVAPDSDDIKLIDFGLAAVLKEGVEIRCKFGTPEFVAPEVVNKEPVSTAADVWGVGVIAYIL